MVHTHGVRGSIPFSATGNPLDCAIKGVLFYIRTSPVRSFEHRGNVKEDLMRIGTGYDVHRLTEERRLIIGGVDIPYEKGLLGHSDADVLLHAVMDALLGAAALGDIGAYFPDSDDAYKGISSVKLLERVAEILADNNYIIENIDSTVIAQKPRLAPHIQDMRKNIAGALGIDVSRVSVKATTEEGLGFTGSGEGIAAQASALLSEVENYMYGDIMNDGRQCGGCPGCCHSSEAR